MGVGKIESMEPTFTDRCESTLLGLALGDAYGRPLEFLSGAMVRSLPVALDQRFMWTDDTHMALYLAEACLELEGFDEERFGDAVGRAFGRWLEDPLMPSTAPGNTCLAGARAWMSGRDWRTSGVRRSDGCGAVMRIAPLPMCLSGLALDRAAHIQAMLTHAHPNAPETAVVGCRLVRALLEGEALSPGLVEGLTPSSGDLSEGLRAAVRVGTSSCQELPEGDVPTGDGGWRAVSALSLAVAAALRWGEDFETAVDRSARIDGDSDSVACLTGMLLGAAGRPLPAAWLQVLPRREAIRDTARALSRGLH